MMAISSIVNPMLCMWMVRYGSSDDVARIKNKKMKNSRLYNKNKININFVV